MTLQEQYTKETGQWVSVKDRLPEREAVRPMLLCRVMCWNRLE